MKTKSIPLNQWLEFQKEYEESGWTLRGYSEYVCGVPRYAELEESSEAWAARMCETLKVYSNEITTSEVK